MKKLALLSIFLALPIVAFAQTVNSFSVTTSAISLPNGKDTLVGTDAGIALVVTPNISIFERNILGSGNAFQFFGGGAQYNFPVLSTKLNNASVNLDGMRFQFFGKGSAGLVKVPMGNHYGFTAGGGVNYDLTGKGTWSFGGSIEYAKFPGYVNNTFIVEAGPALHF